MKHINNYESIHSTLSIVHSHFDIISFFCMRIDEYHILNNLCLCYNCVLLTNWLWNSSILKTMWERERDLIWTFYGLIINLLSQSNWNIYWWFNINIQMTKTTVVWILPTHTRTRHSTQYANAHIAQLKHDLEFVSKLNRLKVNYL